MAFSAGLEILGGPGVRAPRAPEVPKIAGVREVHQRNKKNGHGSPKIMKNKMKHNNR